MQPYISFRKHFSEDGTVSTQRINVDIDTIERLNDAIRAEIAMGYPQKEKYAQTSGNELFYLKPIGRVSYSVAEINHTQARFINLFLKLELKDSNSYLFVRL